MTQHVTVKLLKEFLDAFNRNDLDAIMEFFADDDKHWACGDFGVSEWTLTGTMLSGKRIEVRGV